MNIPKHIGIICDGNRRFAKVLGEEPWRGHELGAEKIREIITWCHEFGIKILTLWLFSTENFKRPDEEKEKLFEIAKKTADDFIKEPLVKEYGIRLNLIGNLTRFPEDVKSALQNAVEQTKNNSGFLLNIAIGYGGKHEILECVRKIAKLVSEGKLKPEEINFSVLNNNMYSGNIPNVDLVIRTSGEQRTSGFLIWKTDYAEYYFSEKYWPEFDKDEFIKALMEYSRRQRRFGK